MDSFFCDRYTQFPSLNYGTEAVPSQASATWKLDNIIDLDRLILAWASILSRLSEEESPVIQIDGAAARIHLESGHIESVQIEKSGNDSGSRTAIVTSDVRTITYPFQQSSFQY